MIYIYNIFYIYIYLYIYISPFSRYSSSKMHDIDLDFQNWSTSNVNMPIESPYMLLYFMEIVIVAVSFTISKIFAFRICLTLTFRNDQCQMYL